MNKVLAGSAAVAIGALALLLAVIAGSGKAEAATYNVCHDNTVTPITSYAQYLTHNMHGDWWANNASDQAACESDLEIPPHTNGTLQVCRAGAVVTLTYSGGTVAGFQAGDQYIFTLTQLAACTV